MLLMKSCGTNYEKDIQDVTSMVRRVNRTKGSVWAVFLHMHWSRNVPNIDKSEAIIARYSLNNLQA